MSPLSVRRYRAERLLREQFEHLRSAVTAGVGGRLRAGGLSLDACDLEACYAQAWQGLYTAVLEGQEIANPRGWLTVVMFRRAVDELRERRPPQIADVTPDGVGARAGGHSSAREEAADPDLASELDNRIALGRLFEGLRARLSPREREAAALCYLQGLSRSQAAARMGISAARMRKLMDGGGRGRPGVAQKVGAVADAILAGRWCEEQGSMMRGLAYGVLDPQGERYQVALMHASECPSCRTYVLALRGLAAALPPMPALLRWAQQAARAAHLRGAAYGSGATASHAGAGALGGFSGGAGLGAGPVAVGAGGGAVSGGWLAVGGGAAAKLAVACLLAAGVGAGCVALATGGGPRHAAGRHPRGAREADRPHSQTVEPPVQTAATDSVGVRATQPSRPALSHVTQATLTPAAKASREFGLEQPATASAVAAAPSAARAASLGRTSEEAQPTSTDITPGRAGSGSRPPTAGASTAGPPDGSAAEREFGIG